jgi:hypothetical protein
MAGDTVDIGGKHEAWRIRNADSSGPPIKIPGSEMRFFVVAPITIGRNMGEGRDLANLMPQRRVATGAFDLVVGDMFYVHELRGIFRGQEDRFIMTFYALSLGDMAIPLYDAEMAFLASDPPSNILFVIEVPALDFDISFGLHVAGRTPSDGA